MDQFLLKEAFNQYFQTGCKTHTKRELLVYGARNLAQIKACLDDWQSQGLVQVVKPLEEAKDTDVVVRVLKLIDGDDKKN